MSDDIYSIDHGQIAVRQDPPAFDPFHTALMLEDAIYENRISKNLLDDRISDMGSYNSYLDPILLATFLLNHKDDYPKGNWEKILSIWEGWNYLSPNYGILARAARRIIFPTQDVPAGN